jgi:hypothetical protein
LGRGDVRYLDKLAVPEVERLVFPPQLGIQIELPRVREEQAVAREPVVRGAGLIPYKK